jgi:hypothetical protein
MKMTMERYPEMITISPRIKLELAQIRDAIPETDEKAAVSIHALCHFYGVV